MIVVKQDTIIFGKLFKKGETINNNINGKIYSIEEIKSKLDEKNFKYEIIEKKTEKTEKNEKNNEKTEKRGK